MSDVHLSHKPPLARSCEKDWYEVQARYLEQVEKIRAEHDAVCLIAGDLFHSWREPSECVNFAMKHLPKNCYAIPGQHDLPYHRYENIKQTPYWTLVQAGVIENIPVDEWRLIRSNIRVHAFPWGFPITPPAEPDDGIAIQVALVHKYIWRDATNCYHGASVDSSVDSLATRGDFKGYHALFFGDNHSGFIAGGGAKGPTIFNCGTLIRRRSDEYAYTPRVGLLKSDGSIEAHFLDVNDDKFIPAADNTSLYTSMRQHTGMKEFIEGLERLENSGINFVDTIKREMIKQKLSGAEQAIILHVLEGRNRD